MLDSIRELFDMLFLDLESIGFGFVEYKNFEDVASAINGGKCPVVDVLGTYLDPKRDGSHVMVATGLNTENGIDFIQLKNSYADNPDEPGKVQFSSLVRNRCLGLICQSHDTKCTLNL